MKIKNEEAVSPVIGVILMVAITVVLAAVLYVWASSFVQTGNATPKATMAITDPNNDFAVKITGISRKADINETTWAIMDSAESTVSRGETFNIYDFGQMGGYAFTGTLPTTGTWHYNVAGNHTGGYMHTDAGVSITISGNYWYNGGSDAGYSTHNQIIFSNNDEAAEPGAWKVSAEDQYFIRGPQNGGASQVGYIFKMIYDPSGEQIANMPLG